MWVCNTGVLAIMEDAFKLAMECFDEMYKSKKISWDILKMGNEKYVFIFMSVLFICLTAIIITGMITHVIR